MTRRGENIYKRKDGRYEGRYIKEYDCFRKAKYKAVYAKSYSEAKQKLKIAKESVLATKLSTESTVSEWFSVYLSNIRESIKITTHDVYLGYCKNHITPYFKDTRLNRLNKEMLQNFINNLSEGGLSPRTVQAIFIFVKNGLREAYDRNFIGVIWDNIHIPKLHNFEMRVFTTEEQKRIENVIEHSEISSDIGIFICLYTGIRIGELCALRWEDVDLENGTLSVNQTVQRIKNEKFNSQKTKIVILPPKSNSSLRTIPLPEFVTERLKHYQRKTVLSEYVISNNSNPVEPRAYRYRFKRVLEIAGVKNANFHTTRHTFATRALELGFDVKTLSEILGHSSATITLNKYAHSLDEHKRNRMELFSNL